MEKKTKYIAGVSAIVASLIIGSVVYTESLNKLVLAKDTVTLELGEKLSTNPHDYLAKDVTDKVKELTINNSAILKDKEFTYDSKNQELVSKDKEFLNVGNYKLTFKYKDQTADVNVSVKDTKAPVVTQNKTEVSVVEGTKSIDYKSFFKTEDLDKTTLTIDDKEVNLSKAGTYKVKVTAEDASKNKTEKELKVIVTAKPKPKPKPVAKPKPKPSNPNNSNKKPSNGGSSTTKPSTPKPSNPKPKPSPAWPKKYSDSTLKITITKEWYKNAYVYAAHVNLTDYSRFFTSNGNNKYGSKETTSHSAKRQGAILAINGSYSAPYLGYGVVRAGKVYNDKPANNMPGVWGRATGILSSSERMGYHGIQLSTLAKEGKVSDTFCFGPEFNTGIGMTDKSRAQRTFIGSNEKPGDFWLVVSDGRYNDGKSKGLTYKECWDYLKSKGCTYGAPLDGGGSSTMYFQGQVLNAERGHERAVVDHALIR